MFLQIVENESGTTSSLVVEQMRKEMEQKIVELTGRLKLKDEVFSYFSRFLIWFRPISTYPLLVISVFRMHSWPFFCLRLFFLNRSYHEPWSRRMILVHIVKWMLRWLLKFRWIYLSQLDIHIIFEWCSNRGAM